MTSLNAKAVRDEFAALARTALIGASKPTQEVKEARGETIEASPLLVIPVIKVWRHRRALGVSKLRTNVRLGLYIFVPSADADNNRTEQIAEDQMLEIEQALADLIAASTQGTSWDYLTFTEDNQFGDIVPMEINKQPYLVYMGAADAFKDDN